MRALLRGFRCQVLVPTLLLGVWIGAPVAFCQGEEDDAVDQQLAQLIQEARFQDALPIAEHALTTREQALGLEAIPVLVTVVKLAYIYDGLKRYADAELMFKRALPMQEKSLGHDSLNFSMGLSNFARFYVKQDRYSEAEPLYREELEIKQKIFGTQVPPKWRML